MKRLDTVEVPDDVDAAFAAAEKVVAAFFAQRKDDLGHGTIEISGERYLLVRAASLSVEFFGLVHDLYGLERASEADEFARNILFDLAHVIGRKDAKAFHEKTGLTDPYARMASGPVMFAHSGWASVKILPTEMQTPDEEYFALYEHPYSFEADAWIRAGQTRDFPVCIMSAGYSSGWCEESWGIDLVAVEIRCRARGDDACRFVMAPPHRIEERAKRESPSGTVVIPDFFARKRAEEDLRRAHQELERRVEERTAQLTLEMEERRRVEAELHQQHKLEALGRLASGVAHDFNNLMSVVLANAALLERATDPLDHRHAFVEEITVAGKRAADLTRQLLAFGRGAPKKREHVELDRVVEELGRMLTRLIGDNIAITVVLESAGARVLADRGEIEQVLVNLVVNARDAMPHGGKLSVETSTQQSSDGAVPCESVRLRVSDSGIGMDKDTISAIFDPFFTTKEGGRGTGLGLSTVYGIVQRAGGTISVESALGTGSTFTILFPCVGEVPERIDAPSSAPSEAQRGDGQTVLLVEDFKMLRSSLERMLAFLNYRVLSASDPAEAMTFIDDGAAPDVLITDLMLPQMSGSDLAEKVEAKVEGLRVLFISGNPSDELNERRRSGKSAAFLAKPFAADALGAALRDLLR